MSYYGDHGTQKAIRAAAAVHVEKFMAEQSAENLRALRKVVGVEGPQNRS